MTGNNRATISLKGNKSRNAHQQNMKPKKSRLSGHDRWLKKLKTERATTQIKGLGENAPYYVGQIVDFDNYTVTLELEDGDSICVFKHAIATLKKVGDAEDTITDVEQPKDYPTLDQTA